ncbi:MAG: porphobilinogen synthase [Candidatus Nanopelagicales bacterium]
MSGESLVGKNLLGPELISEGSDSELDTPELLARPRRLRRTPAMRRLVREVRLNPADLVLPLFYKEGLTEPQEIPSMPGVYQHSLDSLKAAANEVAELGLGGLMLFGVPATRDPEGSGATDPNGALSVAVREVADEVAGSTVIMADLCLDEFTSHGHCGVLGPDGSVDNDQTLEQYQKMAVLLGDCGVDMVGTSGMMDGQVGAVREALDFVGLSEVGIIAYGAKYASALYGPFRDAVESELEGDRKTYQQDSSNRVEGWREAQLDVEQGADIVMVKPAGMYLDVVSDVAASVEVPVAAYQVSGEYAMIEASAQFGMNRDQLAYESLLSIKRAGADIVLTYYAKQAATSWIQNAEEWG